ncbi:cytochrome c oxidase subunit II, partial [Mesorhizobium sp. M7A.F.Ca.CA.001.05.1.1]
MRAISAAPILALAGCGDRQSALHAHGANARRILDLIWSFSAIAVATWLLVMLILAAALLRRRLSETTRSPLEIDSRQERRFTRAVGSAIALTVLVLIMMTIASFFAGKSIASLSGTE